ncbi:hypothetical protein AT6N2_C0688 [Agrobacterium tumefaciens]|nr:hypothetical protein AT6N2_C0688 [Agrobacterium tumefaciens]
MPAPSIAEVAVKDCRDVTHEWLSSLGYGKNTGIQTHNAVPVASGKLLRLIPHGLAHRAETALHVREIDGEVAHQPFDHVRAKMIVRRQFDPLDGGQAALAHHALIFGRRHHVLHIALRQAADGGCAKSDQRIGSIGRIALEIPPQSPSFCRLAQGIGRLGEMIEPDLVVTGALEHLTRHGHLAVTFGNVRQGMFRDKRLVFLHPRHMGIAEKRDTIGVERYDLIDSCFQCLAGLKRQSIKNVAIDRTHAPRPHGVYHGFRLLEGLNPIDGFLHFVIKILHAEARPRHADGGKRVIAAVVQIVGIHLDADFWCEPESEVTPQTVHQALHVFRVKHGGRAAAEMHGTHHRIGRNKRADRSNLLLKCLKINSNRLVFQRVLGMAGTEPAQPVAIGNMQVKREAIPVGERTEPAAINTIIDSPMEMRSGRVAGVTRNGPGIFGKKRGTHHPICLLSRNCRFPLFQYRLRQFATLTSIKLRHKFFLK